MATTVTATASAPKASSVTQLPTPPAGVQYYFSITVQTPNTGLLTAERWLFLRACPLPALQCMSLQPVTHSFLCSVLRPSGPAPHHTATTSAWYVLPSCQPACAFFHCAAASSTICLVSPSLHSAAPMSALLWAQLSSPAGLWMEPRRLDAPYAHPTPDRRSGGRAKTRGCARRTDMLLAPPLACRCA